MNGLTLFGRACRWLGRRLHRHVLDVNDIEPAHFLITGLGIPFLGIILGAAIFEIFGKGFVVFMVGVGLASMFATVVLFASMVLAFLIDVVINFLTMDKLDFCIVRLLFVKDLDAVKEEDKQMDREGIDSEEAVSYGYFGWLVIGFLTCFFMYHMPMATIVMSLLIIGGLAFRKAFGVWYDLQKEVEKSEKD